MVSRNQLRKTGYEDNHMNVVVSESVLLLSETGAFVYHYAVQRVCRLK